MSARAALSVSVAVLLTAAVVAPSAAIVGFSTGYSFAFADFAGYVSTVCRAIYKNREISSVTIGPVVSTCRYSETDARLVETRPGYFDRGRVRKNQPSKTE
jgi:hypothetical protein